jgi:hypothetical protein
VSMTSGRSVSANSNYRALERQIRNRERRRVLTTGAAINIVGRSSTRDVYPLALHQVASRVPGAEPNHLLLEQQLDLSAMPPAWMKLSAI